MLKPTSPDLASRLTHLESTIKRDRIIGIFVLAFVLVGARAVAESGAKASGPIVVHTTTGSATLDGSGLTVRDSSGQERAFYGLDDEGRPDIDMMDSKGLLRQSIYLLSDEPTIRQFDANGKRRVDLFLDDSNEARLTLSDASENVRINLQQSASDEPYLQMSDASQNTRVHIGGYTDGTIGLDLRDAANSVLWKAP